MERRLREIAGDIEHEGFFLIDSEDREKWPNAQIDLMQLYVYNGADLCEHCLDAVLALINRLPNAQDEYEQDKTIYGSTTGHQSDTTKACHWCTTQLSFA